MGVVVEMRTKRRKMRMMGEVVVVEMKRKTKRKSQRM